MAPTDSIETTESDKGLPRITISELEKWVNDRTARFAVLSGIDNSTSLEASIVAIMMRMNYMPKRELLAGAHRIDPTIELTEYGLSRIATRHISADLLADLDVEIELAESDSRVEVLTMHDGEGNLAEGTLYVSDGGGMVYSDHNPIKLDTTVDRGEGFGGW